MSDDFKFFLGTVCGAPFGWLIGTWLAKHTLTSLKGQYIFFAVIALLVIVWVVASGNGPAVYQSICAIIHTVQKS